LFRHPPSSTLFPYTTLFRSVVREGGEGRAVLLDEDGRGRPPRESLDAHTARPREEIEEGARLEIRHEGVQAGDAHLVRRGPRRPALGSDEPLPLELAREHPHQPIPARSSLPRQ